MFGNYSKLVGSIVGSGVAILVAYLATKGLGTCAPPIEPNGEQVCSVLGFTTGQITGTLITLVSAGFVYFFPANRK
jgi:hypothetical protein